MMDAISLKYMANPRKGICPTAVNCANFIQFNVSGADALEVPSQDTLVIKSNQNCEDSCSTSLSQILLQNDPDEERSSKVSRGVNPAIACYKTLLSDTESMEK